jgi:hypothetical protein
MTLRPFALAALTLALAAPAGAETLKARYGISMLGVPIGQATMSGEFGQSYSLELYLKLTGLASMVSDSKGSAKSTGALAGGRVEAQTYATTASAKDATRTVRMAISGGAVRGVEISPPFEDKPGRVPLTEAHKRGVLDPLSALVMALPSGQPAVGPAACNRTLPVFDGYTRFDVTLSYVGARNVSGAGYNGPVSVCATRYTPIAGHRADRPQTKFMAENRQMEAWLAPVGQSGAAIPYRIAVKTQIGMVVIEAKEFAVSGGSAAAGGAPVQPAKAAAGKQ